MRVRWMGWLLAALGLALGSPTAQACCRCGHYPCVIQPAYTCVTELVPYTVYKNVWHMEYDTCTYTVMAREPVTNYVERQRVVCKPVYDTIEVPYQRIVCKPIHETDYITQTYTVCKPVHTTHQVTTYCWKPTAQSVVVPTGQTCCICHKDPCCCKVVTQICYTPVPVVKDVVTTCMVPECRTRQVPITRTHYEQEVVNDVRRITKCRIVQEVVTEKVPYVTWTCVPKEVTKKIPRPVCEQVAVTCYKRCTRLVPCTYEPVCAPAPAPCPQGVPAPSIQSGPSIQSAPTKQG